MATDLELLSASDKPALLAISQPELLETCRAVLRELNYKVHAAGNREEFLSRFTQIQYEIVLLEDLFSAPSLSENLTLQSLQTMPMNLRRQATTILIGDSFQTLHPMQAFHQSVHAVVNRTDLDKLSLIVQKVLADNNLFLNVYRETQLRAAQAKA
jgi:hypothetical protein